MERIGLEAALELAGWRRGVAEYTGSITNMEGKTGKFASVMKGAGKAVLGIGAAGAAAAAGGIALAVKGLASTIGPASDLEESINKVSVVFGDNSQAVLDWSKTAAEALGATRQQALEAAGTFGNLFTSMGMGQDISADMSQDLVQLAADLGSFNNITVDVALEKLRSGLVGEVEPLRTLGVNINQAAVEAKALEMGLIQSGEEMTDQQKIQARYALILEQTANAQGDFARTSDGLANQQKILKARFEDIKATIGKALIPSISKLAGKFSEWMNSPAVKEGIQKLVDWLGEMLPKVIEMASDYLTNYLIPGIKDVVSWIRDNLVPAVQVVAGWIRDYLIPAIQTVAGWFRGEGSSAIGAFVEKIRAFLAPAIEFAQQMFQKIVSWVRENWPLIQETISTVMEAIRTVVERVLNAIRAFWDEHGATITQIVTSVWNIIKTVVSTAIDIVQGVIKTVMQIITGDWEGAWETIKGIGRTVWDAIQNIIRNAWEVIKGIFQIAWAKIKEIWEGVGEWFRGIGESIVEGIKEGIKGAWDAFVNWVLDKLGSIIQEIKNFLGIESPSKVFAGIGQNLMSGLARGISGGIEMPVTAMVNAGTATVGAMTATTAGAATGSGMTSTVNKTVRLTQANTINNQMDLAEFQARTLQTVQQALRGA